MSHEDEITTGPFDEGDEHDYSDHHHHHQHENEHEQWNNDEKNDEKPETATKRNLYISNLSFETNEDILREKFSIYGEITNAEIVRDPGTKQSRGFGFITYANPEDGENAVNSMNGAEINGRPIRVEHSRRSQGHTKTPGRYLGPKGTSSRFNDRERRGRYDGGYHNGGPRRRSGSRDRRPSYGGYRRSRSKDRGYSDRSWGGDGRYDSRGPPPPSDRWSGGRRSRSRSRDRGGPPRPSYGGYDNRRDRR